MKRSSVDMDLLPRRVARAVHSRSMCWTWSWTIDSRSVVVSGEGSPVSPETNIICGIVRFRPTSKLTSNESRASGDAGRDIGGEESAGEGVEEAMVVASCDVVEGKRVSQGNVWVAQALGASCG